MNTALHQIILDWIGEDTEVSNYCNDLVYNRLKGYTQCIKDLRERAPELVEKIVKTAKQYNYSTRSGSIL